ncbi:MAG: hypothetical protein ACRCT7_03740, partial [Shewanella sp.]
LQTKGQLSMLHSLASNYVAPPEPTPVIIDDDTIQIDDNAPVPNVDEDRKDVLISIVETIWSTIQNHCSKTNALDEIEFLIQQIRDKGKQNYGG